MNHAGFDQRFSANDIVNEVRDLNILPLFTSGSFGSRELPCEEYRSHNAFSLNDVEITIRGKIGESLHVRAWSGPMDL